jgi:translocation and assembly module TamB
LRGAWNSRQAVALVDAFRGAGERISGSTGHKLYRGRALSHQRAGSEGSDYRLTGNELNGVGTGLETKLDAMLAATDLSRFSALAGYELDGALPLAVTGIGDP